MKSYTRGIAALLTAFAVAACEEGTGPGDEFDAALNEDDSQVPALTGNPGSRPRRSCAAALRVRFFILPRRSSSQRPEREYAIVGVTINSKAEHLFGAHNEE